VRVDERGGNKCKDRSIQLSIKEYYDGDRVAENKDFYSVGSPLLHLIAFALLGLDISRTSLTPETYGKFLLQPPPQIKWTVPY